MASLGAGAIHAAAVGTHGEHRQAVVVFAVLGVLQLAWGAGALVRPGKRLAVAGVVLHGGALAGWVVAKTGGLGVVDGLGAAEAVQLADGVAAALAGVSVLLALRWLLGAVVGQAHPVRSGVAAVAALVSVALAGTGMVAAGEHRHVRGNGHDHVAEAVSAVAPVPYDPERPIDLGGVPGVTPAQQARAENLVAVTLARLPRFSDPSVAEAEGFRSIGDGFTGHEHYLHPGYVADDEILNPDRPESLVYDTTVTPKKLVSAMFMLPPGSTLDDVPDLGGPLTQWHVHDDLCFSPGGRVAGLREPSGSCPEGLRAGIQMPMIHVWITPHRCGPFAALEGVAAGSIPAGEERLCDHVHGAPE